jgi:hypothetical protein
MSLPKHCPKCGEPMEEVIAAQAQQRNGWYCVACKEFIKATGRERLIIKDGARNGRT